MVIDAPEPLVIPATDEKVFDKVWLTGLGVNGAAGPGQPVVVNGAYRLYRDVGSDFEWSPGAETVVNIPDLYAEIAVNPSLAPLPDTIVQAILLVAASRKS